MHLNALSTAEINLRQPEGANRLSEQRGDLASGLSIEINECLTAIDTGLQTLQAMHLEDAGRDITDGLVSNVHKMEGIVNRLLALP